MYLSHFLYPVDSRQSSCGEQHCFNAVVQASLCSNVFVSFGHKLSSEMVGLYGKSASIVKEISILFSKMVALMYITTLFTYLLPPHPKP